MQNPFRNMPRSSKFFLTIGLGCGVATILTAAFFAVPIAALLPALLSEGALIFLSALIVERTLLHEVSAGANRRADELARHVDSTTKEFFRNEFDILKYSEQYSVFLCPPRRSVTQNPNLAYQRIATAISRGRRIRLFCTSGIDIFPPPNVPSVIADQIRAKAHQATDTFEIAVLSCDPNGEYASVRGGLENVVNPKYLGGDVTSAYRSLLQIAKMAHNAGFAFTWSTYDFVPQAWFLLTEREGFAEVYHFGLGRRAPYDPLSCIGGRVPMLTFTAGSALWQALDEYFSFLVTPNNDPNVEKIRAEYFRVKPYP